MIPTIPKQTKEFDVLRIRQDFPALQQTIHGLPLIYFDNAATSQKPSVVIEAIRRHYEQDNANIHRGVHTLSQRATEAYENARKHIAQFVHAKSTCEIIFTKGTTESINLVAQSYGRTFLKAGDEIILSMMEHHANIVPWQMLCEQIGAKLKIIPLNAAGELCLDTYTQLLSEKTKLVTIVHVSNSLGTINPIKKIIDLAHTVQAKVLIDGAQATQHLPVNVTELDCDFYTFSSHKLLGPTGFGILYAKESLLENMPPYQGGGDMIKMVSFTKTLYNDLPHKFEAGTPHISGAIGLSSAISYLEKIGFDHIQTYEHSLLNYATQQLQHLPNLQLIGTAKSKASILSFVLSDIHAHDVGTILDRYGIAVRTGHHCTMPIMDYYKIPATIRASLAFYNTKEEIDALIDALFHTRKVFKL